jgi:hypothetical protein
MKKLFNISIVLLILFIIPGCLRFGSIEYRITFDENYSGGSVAIFYRDITSSDSTVEKQQGDFDDVVQMINSDEFLLDQLNDGVYVKERRLFEENGKLNALIKGIFRELHNNDMSLKVDKEEIVLTFKEDDDSRFESDGKVMQTENNVIITWPKTTHEIYFKVFPVKDEKIYSLIDYYREWNAKY